MSQQQDICDFLEEVWKHHKTVPLTDREKNLVRDAIIACTSNTGLFYHDEGTDDFEEEKKDWSPEAIKALELIGYLGDEQ